VRIDELTYPGLHLKPVIDSPVYPKRTRTNQYILRPLNLASRCYDLPRGLIDVQKAVFNLQMTVKEDKYPHNLGIPQMSLPVFSWTGG
jgi:hypothetical protein